MFLTNPLQIKLRNSCDRYGFSYTLASNYGMQRTPRCFANWIHGWVWGEEFDAEHLLGLMPYDKQMSIVVNNEKQKEVLMEDGYSNVTVGGLPYIYIPNQQLQQIPGSLLAFLPHSSEGATLCADHVDYLDFLEACLTSFSKIYVSVFSLDANDVLIKEIKKRNLIPLTGARPDDRYSLIRLRQMLEQSEYVTANHMGSSIAYALYTGCKVSISGPTFEYDENVFAKDSKHYKLYKDYFDKFISFHSLTYQKRLLPWIFTTHPCHGIQNKAFGNEAVGMRYKLDKTDVIRVLNWGGRQQIRCYASGLSRRLTRIFKY